MHPAGVLDALAVAHLKTTRARIDCPHEAPPQSLPKRFAPGIVSFKGPPLHGVAEIGYGVAEGRRARGHATRAVALMIVEADALGLDLMAETASDHRPSQLVLERNGFRRCGERVDAEDGALVVWRRERGARADVVSS